MSVLDRFLPRQEFDSYEDFKQELSREYSRSLSILVLMLSMPGPKRTKIKRHWSGATITATKRIFTFEDIRRLSNQAAHFFIDRGINKGSVVMLILRRRWEYWIAAVALHKIGAILDSR